MSSRSICVEGSCTHRLIYSVSRLAGVLTGNMVVFDAMRHARGYNGMIEREVRSR